MENEGKTDLKAMLMDGEGAPTVEVITDKSAIKRYGGARKLFVPPMEYDRIMRLVPKGRLITVDRIREYLARSYDADFTDPMTAEIFIMLRAWSSAQRTSDQMPYWRTLKADGELNPKYPGGIEAQRAALETEGHVVIQKGRQNARYYVKDYENSLFDLNL